MADSNAHKLGQIIGDTLELAIEPHLLEFAQQYGLYLDKKGVRLCRKSKKVSWTDINGNSHDLDFVFERGGSGDVQGDPVAFIEIAWRRYTKHSRAKAQEIQGAVEPLYQKYRSLSPFKGAILAGVFTAGALNQLESLGFKIVYVDYETIIAAFRSQGVDVAFKEETPEAELKSKVEACHALSKSARLAVGVAMLSPFADKLKEFFAGLQMAVERKVTSVSILALFGSALQVTSIEEAVALVNKFAEEPNGAKFNRYEIRIEFNNGDYIEGQFKSKADAISFLNKSRS